MNLKEIREMIKIMNENDLTEIEIEREGHKIKLKKAAGEYIESVVKSPPKYVTEQAAVAPTSEDVEGSGNPNHKQVKSPMVGTFYRSPSPEAPAFVDIGQVVEVGQVVCIVEAMKLMNEIKSTVKGKIVESLVDNAQPVEFGQALFSIESL